MLLGTVRVNFLANLLGRFWSFASVYLFVPLYIKYLGLESYGIVGRFAVLQSVMMIADAGLTATLTRELARLAPHPDRAKDMRDLVRTVEVCYWLIALVAGLGLHFFADLFVSKWIHAPGITHETLVTSVRLMAWTVVMQLPATLYQGGLLGLQRQVLSNALQSGWSLVKNGGVILAMMGSPTLETFFSWSLACNIVYSALVGYLLYRSLPTQDGDRSGDIKLKTFLDIGPYAAGMLGITVLSAVFMQTDKVLISAMLPLKEFSYYTLAAMIAQTPVILVGPISMAVFPRLTALVSTGDTDGLRQTYHRSCQVVAWVAIPFGVGLACFGNAVLLLWTRSAEAAAGAGPIVIWFAIGSTALAVLIIPHQLALANGYLRLNILLSIFGIMIFVPTLVWSVRTFGASGGGMAWAILNTFVLATYVYFLHRKFMPGATRRWYLVDLGIPLCIYLAAGGLVKFLLPADASPFWVAVAAIGGMSAGAVATAFAIPGFLPFLLLKTK